MNMNSNEQNKIIDFTSSAFNVSSEKLRARMAQRAKELHNSSDIINGSTCIFRLLEEVLAKEYLNQCFPLTHMREYLRQIRTPSFSAFRASQEIVSGFERLTLLKPLEMPIAFEISHHENAFGVNFSTSFFNPRYNIFYPFKLISLIELMRHSTGVHIVPLKIAMPKIFPHLQEQLEEYVGVAFTESTRVEIIISKADSKLAISIGQKEGLVEAGFEDIMTKLGKTIVELLPSGKIGIEHVAMAMAMSQRSLQRRLAEKGSTYREILTSTRMIEADKYLSDGRYAIAEIAYLLGYSDVTAFYRAYKKACGKPPKMTQMN